METTGETWWEVFQEVTAPAPAPWQGGKAPVLEGPVKSRSGAVLVGSDPRNDSREYSNTYTASSFFLTNPIPPNLTLYLIPQINNCFS